MESYPPTLGVTLYSARMFGFRIVALLTLVTTMFHLQNDPAGAAATTRMLTKRRLARQTADGTTCAHIVSSTLLCLGFFGRWGGGGVLRSTVPFAKALSQRNINNKIRKRPLLPNGTSQL